MPFDGSAGASAGCRVQGAPARAIRVAIASDNRLLRDGLHLLLAGWRQQPIEVVDIADLAAPVRRLARMPPDALLVDASAPAGIALVRQAHRLLPAVKLVALGLAEIEPAILAGARAGMAGFVAPDASIEQLVAAIRSALAGELVCSPRVAALLLGQLGGGSPGDAPADPPAPLTRREGEIAALMEDGLSNKQIARHLGIRDATVKNHVHAILAKLRLQRRGEVAARLRQGRLRGLHGLLGPSPRATA